MYPVPTLRNLTLADYRRILAQPVELRAAAPKPPTYDLAMLELELTDTRDRLAQVDQHRLVLETKIIFLKRQVRSVRRSMRNAGWPMAERRTHSRGSGKQ